MTENKQPEAEAPAQFTPRFRTDIYPFIHPSKFRGSLQDKVVIITGMAGLILTCCLLPSPSPSPTHPITFSPTLPIIPPAPPSP